MDASQGSYIDDRLIDVERIDGTIQEGAWRRQVTLDYFQRLGRVGGNRARAAVNVMRDHFAEYLTSDVGAAQAPWQFDRAFRATRLNLP